MSVNNTPPVIGYDTNGVTTSFSFPFKILAASDLAISLSSSSVPGYSVVFDSDVEGGQVNFANPPAIGRLVLERKIALNRTTDYQYQGELPSDEVNNDFDRIVMMVQQIGLGTDRAIKMPATDTADQILTQDAAARAGKALIFDASGNITVSADVFNDQASAAAASAAAAAVSEANAAASAASANSDAGAATLAASQAIGAARRGRLSPCDRVPHRRGSERGRVRAVYASGEQTRRAWSL